MTSNPLDEIRRLYFNTTAATIQRDIDRAIDLLKSLPDEDARGRAAVFMEGLAEMRKEWRGTNTGQKSGARRRDPRGARRRETGRGNGGKDQA